MAWAGAIDVKPDNIMQLVDELTVVGKLELVDPVWPGDHACTRCAGPNYSTACATISNSGSPRTGRLGHKTLSDVRQGEMREGRLSCDRPRSCQLHTLGRAYRHRLRSTRRSRTHPVNIDAFQDLKVRFVPLQSSRTCGADVSIVYVIGDFQPISMLVGRVGGAPRQRRSAAQGGSHERFA